MADRHLKRCERAARVEEWRRAWFDGWTEGVVWTVSKCVHALREGGYPEAVGGASSSLLFRNAPPQM